VKTRTDTNKCNSYASNQISNWKLDYRETFLRTKELVRETSFNFSKIVIFLTCMNWKIQKSTYLAYGQ